MKRVMKHHEDSNSDPCAAAQQLQKFIQDNLDDAILSCDVFAPTSKCRREGLPVINLTRVGSHGKHFDEVRTAGEAKSAVSEMLSRLGLSDYVVGMFPYADGGRGFTWYSVSVRFDPSVIEAI